MGLSIFQLDSDFRVQRTTLCIVWHESKLCRRSDLRLWDGFAFFAKFSMQGIAGRKGKVGQFDLSHQVTDFSVLNTESAEILPGQDNSHVQSAGFEN